MSSSFKHGQALIVGVGADLPNTVDDAQGLAAILKDPTRCAYPAEQVRLLTGSEATREAVLAALDALTKTTDAGSTVIVYFSGHGYRLASAAKTAYYLLPYGYNMDWLQQTALSGQDFVQKLRTIPARKLLLLLDCCHAGGVGEAKAPELGLTKAPLPPEAISLLAEGSGRVLIASSREDERSFAGKPYSAFTLALIEALCGIGVARRDSYVRVADIALHTRQVVPGRTKERQHPILHFEHADNFALAYYAGGNTQPKGLPFEAELEIEPEPGAWRGISQPGQTIQGPQTNIVGNVEGPVLSGQFGGPVSVGGGEAVDMRGARDVIYKPSGPVDMGDRISVHGDGNIIGHFGRSTVIKPSVDSVTLEGFLRLLAGVRKGLPAAGLDMEVAQVIEADLQSVESQAHRSKPNRMLLLIKLKNVVDLLSASKGGGRDSDRVLLQAELALAWGQQLFGL